MFVFCAESGGETLLVRVFFAGLLRRYIGEQEGSVELPDGATVEDLIREVAEAYRDRFPANFLPEGQHSFTRLVQASRRGGPFCRLDEKLEEGEEILIFSRLAGG
jgi:molybdopterin converting factor small subunit